MPLVGPALGAGGRAYAQEAAPGLENLQAVAVLDGGDGRGLQRDIAADFENGGPHIGLANGGRARRTAAAAGQAQNQRGRHRNLAYGTRMHNCMVAPVAERPMRFATGAFSQRRHAAAAGQLWDDGLEQALFKMRRTSGS